MFNKLEDSIEKFKAEETSQYGEFVASYFAWLTLEKQKDNARKMEKMTHKQNDQEINE